MRGTSKRGLSANAIKLIAAAAMLIDHIAWMWFPVSTAPGFIMHLFGRITAPVMCFFIAEGYYRTRSVGRYALRLLVFALITQMPYFYFISGRLTFAFYSGSLPPAGTFNMLFTLLLGLTALHAMNSRRLPRAARVFIAALCCAATYFCDWQFFAAIFIIAFGARRDDFRRQAAMFFCAAAVMLAYVMLSDGWGSLYQAGVLLALPLLRLYNGERGAGGTGRAGRAVKYAFYIFYPLHLMIIAILKHQRIL